MLFGRDVNSILYKYTDLFMYTCRWIESPTRNEFRIAWSKCWHEATVYSKSTTNLSTNDGTI